MVVDGAHTSFLYLSLSLKQFLQKRDGMDSVDRVHFRLTAFIQSESAQPRLKLGATRRKPGASGGAPNMPIFVTRISPRLPRTRFFFASTSTRAACSSYSRSLRFFFSGSLERFARVDLSECRPQRAAPPSA